MPASKSAAGWQISVECGFLAVEKYTVPKSLAFLVQEGDEAAFKTGVYNVLLFVFLLLCAAGVTAVYHLLFAFLKPIM